MNSHRAFSSFFPTLRASLLAGAAVAGLLHFSPVACAQATAAPVAQTTESQPTGNQTTETQAPQSETPQAQTTVPPTAAEPNAAQPAEGTATPIETISNQPAVHGRGKQKKEKDGKVVQSKDTRKSLTKNKKIDAHAGADAKLPDKQLYDKALLAVKKGHYDVGRLDLQTMLNTYPDSQYQMRAKLAIADSWYKEGGTAALTQAESEYADFRVFFPNVPEAAEAQMRIGDIYFKEMDKPDRDYAKATHAEEEYRRMMTDYPNAPPELMTQAKQRLREVQEVLATRESNIASYYATRENWSATIARYQTVVDTYPLYSHMDDTLVGLGDAYEAQARYIRTLALPEAGKAKLEKLYDEKAADAYRQVVLYHPAAPHVEDARDRLAAMNVPIPEPSKEQMAASVALENSRSNYRISDRARLLILHTPDVVTAARQGEPTLTDPKPTYAPAVSNRVKSDYNEAFNIAPAAAPAAAAPDPATATEAATPAADTATAPPAPLALEDVKGESDAAAPAPTTTFATPGAASSAPAVSGSGASMGVEILTPSAAASPASPDATGGLKAVGPKDAMPLPEIEKAAAAPDRQNEITAPTAAAQTLPAGKKKVKDPFDKSEESSSRHKKKKGLNKVNPF